MSSKPSLKIAVIPDTQVRPGVRTDHLAWAGAFIAEKRPDVVVHLGDHWDMPSLSSYDKGKASAEGKRVVKDIAAGNEALELLTHSLARKDYHPRLIMLRGNHEERLDRYLNDHPELLGAFTGAFADERLGWEVVPFLQPIEIGGVAFCHYFPRSSDGNVAQTKRGAPSARAQLLREMQSCVSGHRQGLDLAVHTNGKRLIRSIIAGSFYQHQEGYLSPQGNHHWRGMLMLHEVRDGKFCLLEVSLDYLRRRYSNSKPARSRK
jgi:predicted phosphodiesterase